MTSGIDPRVALWVNGAVFILSLLAAGSLALPGIPEGVAVYIKAYSADATTLITGLNLIFHWYSAPAAGPGVKGG